MIIPTNTNRASRLLHSTVWVYCWLFLFFCPLVWWYVLCLLYELDMAKCIQAEHCNMLIKLAQTHQRSWLLLGYFHTTIHNGKRQYNKALGSWTVHSLGTGPERDAEDQSRDRRRRCSQKSWRGEKFSFKNDGISGWTLKRLDSLLVFLASTADTTKVFKYTLE